MPMMIVLLLRTSCVVSIEGIVPDIARSRGILEVLHFGEKDIAKEM
jgi:hypothetical protein